MPRTYDRAELDQDLQGVEETLSTKLDQLRQEEEDLNIRLDRTKALRRQVEGSLAKLVGSPPAEQQSSQNGASGPKANGGKYGGSISDETRQKIEAIIPFLPTEFDAGVVGETAGLGTGTANKAVPIMAEEGRFDKLGIKKSARDTRVAGRGSMHYTVAPS